MVESPSDLIVNGTRKNKVKLGLDLCEVTKLTDHVLATNLVISLNT